jgi:hypothetical protein
MYLHYWLKNLNKTNKKASIPGWGYVVALIIGLFLIVALVMISIKSKNFLLDKIEFIKDLI